MKASQHFSVAFDYPVVFTRDVFEPSHPVFVDTLNRLNEKRRHRVVVFVDSNVARRRPDLVAKIGAYFDAHSRRLELVMPPRIVPGGEGIKNDFSLVSKVIKLLIERRLCRHSFVVVIGGGAVLDAIGFAASLVHRGLRLVRLPTTVLSQCDAGVGIKNGINLCGGKNTMGTFSPPFAVLNDCSMLSSLPDREWSGGIAEAFKVSIVCDAAFFGWLCRQAPSLKARNQDAMETMIRRCAKLHLKHIRTSGDPFERGRARPLDFGHWSAHKLEAMSRYRIGHGQAVATGIALDSCCAAIKGWITERQLKAIYHGLQRSGLALWRKELERRDKDGMLEIIKGLRDFQEHIGGELCLTFPRGVGKSFEVHEVDNDLIEKAVDRLKRLGKQP